MHGLTDLDPFLKLGFLELDPYALLQRVSLPEGVEGQHRDRTRLGSADALHAFHRGGLARPVGADEAEDLALADVERDVVDRGVRAVALADA